MTIDTDQVFKAINGLYGIPKASLTFVVCIAAGWVMKRSPWIHNSAIPFSVCIVGGLILPLLSDFKSSAIESVRVWVVTNVVIGFITGALSTLFYKLVVKKLMDKFGVNDSQTDFFQAKDTAVSDPKERLGCPPTLPNKP